MSPARVEDRAVSCASVSSSALKWGEEGCSHRAVSMDWVNGAQSPEGPRGSVTQSVLRAVREARPLRSSAPGRRTPLSESQKPQGWRELKVMGTSLPCDRLGRGGGEGTAPQCFLHRALQNGQSASFMTIIVLYAQTGAGTQANCPRPALLSLWVSPHSPSPVPKTP